MLYKTLRHKTLKDTFGVIMDAIDPLIGPEVGQTNIPELMNYSTTKDGLLEVIKQDPINKTIIEQLNDYNLVIVDLMIIEKE